MPMIANDKARRGFLRVDKTGAFMVWLWIFELGKLGSRPENTMLNPNVQLSNIRRLAEPRSKMPDRCRLLPLCTLPVRLTRACGLGTIMNAEKTVWCCKIC